MIYFSMEINLVSHKLKEKKNHRYMSLLMINVLCMDVRKF